MNQTRKRAPAGVQKERPINLRLLPDERVMFDQMANRKGVSANSLAREAVVAYLHVQDDSTGATAA